MTEIQERIAEVLAEHKAVRVEDLVRRDGTFTCACGVSFTGGPTGYRAHQAAMLTPVIREAQAQVLTEFADAHRIPTPMFRGETMTITVNDLLRAKAEELRSPAIVGPDCRDKKHRACDGTALDYVLDEIIHCQCTCHQ